MNKKTTIRRATTDDLEPIGRLWMEFMDFHKDRDPHFTRAEDGHTNFMDFIGGHITSDDSCVLVAECDGDVMAYCLATLSSMPPVFAVTQYGTVMDLAVSSAHRRKGMGERMYDVVQDWFKEKGISRIEVRVALSNEVSTRFWRKMGYEPYLETVVKEL